MASWSSGYVIGNWIRVSKFESWKFRKFFFCFFFWILLLKSSKNYNGINSIPKNIKGRKKAKKSYFNDDLNLIPMCWHIFYWQCITWQKIRLRGLCLIFLMKILIISMYLKSATSSNVNKNWQDMQCQIWRNSL